MYIAKPSAIPPPLFICKIVLKGIRNFFPPGDVVETKRKILRKGYDDPFLIVKMTSLLVRVSVIRTLKVGTSISFHVS